MTAQPDPFREQARVQAAIAELTRELEQAELAVAAVLSHERDVLERETHAWLELGDPQDARRARGAWLESLAAARTRRERAARALGELHERAHQLERAAADRERAGALDQLAATRAAVEAHRAGLAEAQARLVELERVLARLETDTAEPAAAAADTEPALPPAHPAKETARAEPAGAGPDAQPDVLAEALLDLYASARAKVLLLDAWFDEHGFLDEVGDPRHTVSSYFAAHEAARQALLRIEEHLGREGARAALAALSAARRARGRRSSPRT